MKYHLYILYFRETDRYYVGSTNDLERRINQHKRGHTSSTKRLGSEFKLAFSQEYSTLAKARKVESKIKSWKRRDFIEKIISDGTIKIRSD